MTTTHVDDPLGTYLGRKVQGATIEIRGTGSGLEKGLHMPPLALDPGVTVDVVLRCVVDKHRHDLDDDTGAFTLVNMLKAKRRADIEEARRSASGEDPLPFERDGLVEVGADEMDALERRIRDRNGDPIDDPLAEVEALEAAADDEVES